MGSGNQNFNGTIAEMGAYDFWSSPYALGLSIEDADAIKAGAPSDEQLERARVAGRAAFNAMIVTPVGAARPS